MRNFKLSKRRRGKQGMMIREGRRFYEKESGNEAV